MNTQNNTWRTITINGIEYSAMNSDNMSEAAFKSMVVRNGMTTEKMKGISKRIRETEGSKACKEKQCIFDCPYKAGSEEAEHWMTGYIAEDKIVKFNQYGI